MAGAKANVRNIITIDGVDNASDAVNKAKAALGLLGDQANKTGKATKALAATPTIDAAKIQGTTARAGGALAALTGALGQAGGALGEAGKGFTALGGIAGVLPGPLGLAASAIVGLGAGFYLLAKHVSESNAKLALMGDAKTLSLKDKFDLDIDGAIALTQALGQLKDRGIAPSDQLIAQVVQRAKSVGGEPVEAVKSLADAWVKGAAAVLEYQRAKGNIEGLDQAAMDAKAAQLQIDREAVGIAKGQLSIKDKLNAQFLDAVEASRQLAKAESDYQTLRYKGSHAASSAAQVTANTEANALEDKMSSLRAQAALADKTASGTQQAANRETELADIEKGRATLGQARDAQATTARTKAIGQGIQLQSIGEQRQIIEDEITLLALQQSFLGKKDYDNKLLALQVEKLSLDAKQKGILDADKAEKKAKAQAGTQAAQAARQALAEAQIRGIKARADMDGLQTAKERLDILDREQKKELDATSGTKNAKVRAEQQKAIFEDYNAKRAAVGRQAVADEKKNDDEVVKATADAMQRQVAARRAAEDEIVTTAKMRRASMADVLRGQGRDEEAAEVESKQAHADYSAALIAIDRERVDALKSKDGVVVTTVEAAAIKEKADQKALQAKQALDDVERRIDADRSDRARQARADAVDALEGPANALKALGQLGPQFARAGGLGGGLSAAVKGFKDLDKAMSKSEVKATEVAAAVGGAAQGIGASMIDAEKTR